MVSSDTRQIGGIRRFAAAWSMGFIQPAGLTTVPNRRKSASGNRSGLQRARPTVSVVGGMRCAIPPYAYYGWFTEGFDTQDLKEAKALLEELT